MPAPHIAELRLSHFRSHRNTRLSLDGRPVVLTGPNGVGKTNVLEAVSLLSPGRGLRRAGPDEIARRPEGLGWRVGASVLDAAGRIRSIETRVTPGSSRGVIIDDKPEPQAALGRLLRVLWLVPAMDRLWTEAPEGRRRFLDRIALSFEPDHGSAVLAYDRAMRERNRLLRDQVTDPRWHAALEAQMADAGGRISAARARALVRLAEAAGAAQTAFPVADLTLTGTDGHAPPETRDAIAAALAEGRARDLAAGRTLSGPHRADLTARYRAKDMDAAACSTGEQKALLISLILANARALAAGGGGPPVLLLDEVAAHLDADRRASLYDELEALGAQAFLTGTDPQLFDRLAGRAQMFGVRDAGGESVVTPCPGDPQP